MASEDVIRQVADVIRSSKSIAVMTGAGISVPSGIPDFRSATGLYSTPYGQFPAEVMLSHDFFEEHTEEFYRFYREKMLYPAAKPNSAHILLAELERRGQLIGIGTQNIDGLHQAAGSKRVFELHGSVHRNSCTRCGKRYGLDKILSSVGVPRCDCGGVIKPDVVLYGEGLDEDTIMDTVSAFRRADALIVIGTSLVVYPAAGLVGYFRGKHSILINKSDTYFNEEAEYVIKDDCAAVADKIMQYLDM